VTIVVAYLMKNHQMSLESALSIVRSKRPQIAPNEGFISQLENFDKSLQGKTQIVAVVGLYVKLFQRKVVCISCFMKYFLIVYVVFAIVVVELPSILSSSITHLLPRCLFLIVISMWACLGTRGLE
jgi:hypothetical protein